MIVEFVYAPEALAILAEHGLQPGPSTPPPVVRAALNDLYRYEIRRLKRRLLAGEFAKERYREMIIELRAHYWLLSVPVQRWVRTREQPGVGD